MSRKKIIKNILEEHQKSIKLDLSLLTDKALDELEACFKDNKKELSVETSNEIVKLIGFGTLIKMKS